MKVAFSNLNKEDYSLWLNALKEQPNETSHFLLEWVGGALRRFFPFDRALLIHAELVVGKITITHVLSLGHDQQYLQQLSSIFDLDERGSLRYWLNNQMPFGIDVEDPPASATKFEIDEIEKFNLGRIAAHGILDIKANTGTYFSFAGIPNKLNDWHWDALRLLTPTLNDLFLTYIRSQQKPLASMDKLLTPRQRQIVHYLIDGMGNKAIAKKMNIAEKTVRNQLAEVFNKLGVARRGELVALLR